MINLHKVSFKYRDRKKESLDNIDFSVHKGNLIVITGESGCGKSTLMRCINGLCPGFYEGEKTGKIALNKTDINDLPIGNISKMVSSVFQNPENQFFTLDVLSDIVFACENFGIEKSEIENRMALVTELLSMKHLLGKKLNEISGGEKQKIAIASVLMMGTEIVLMDEPSANLDYQSIRILRDVIIRLKEQKLTIIVAEHRLYYLKDICDNLMVMQDRKITKFYDKESLSRLENSFFHNKGLRSVQLFQNHISSSSDNSKSNKPLLALENISFRYEKGKEVLKEVNLMLNKGDKVALLGKNGCGKTTLAKVLCGLKKESYGKIFFESKHLPIKERSKKIGYVMQDVDFQIFGSSLYDDLFLGNEKFPDIDRRIEEVLAELGLSEMRQEHPMTLSMGQKQRLIVAGTRLSQKKVSILDEPTSGLDYKSMQSVCALIDDLTGEDNAAIIITHDYEFIINSCNRAVLLENGKIIEDFLLEDGKKLKQIFKERL
jgi:energy-coupling factor transporter ATP-binding protein EcfA2